VTEIAMTLLGEDLTRLELSVGRGLYPSIKPGALPDIFAQLK